MQKILVIQTAFIGDVILATGIIEKLHHFFPEAEIDFLVRKGNELLFDSHPFLHEVLIWNKKEKKLKNLWKMLGRIRQRKYDKVINIHRYGTTGFLTAFSGAKMKIGFDKNPFSFLFTVKVPHQFQSLKDNLYRHEIERNNDLVTFFTDDKPFNPKLYPSAADVNAIKPFTNQPYICIAPASVWFTKQYPKERWVEFIRSIPFSMPVYLLGAPGDDALAKEIISAAARDGVSSLCGQLSFLQSAALMRKAMMNYVNDSSPLHLASAVNAPVTAVYCSTIPQFGYGPLSDKSFIVEIPKPLYCRPCGIHGYKACPQGHFRCAFEINNEQLLHMLPPVK